MNYRYLIMALPFILALLLFALPSYRSVALFMGNSIGLFSVFEYAVLYFLSRPKRDPKTDTMIHLAISGLRFFMAMGLLLAGIVVKPENKMFVLPALLGVSVYFLVFGSIYQAQRKK